MTFHTNSKRIPAGFNVGNYEKSEGCHDCDRDVWYETDENGLKWHKALRLCTGSEQKALEIANAAE